jgi:hypothetical protein
MLKTLKVVKIVSGVLLIIMLVFNVGDILFRETGIVPLLDHYDILIFGFIFMICSLSIIYLEALCKKNLPKSQHQSLQTGHIIFFFSVSYTLPFVYYLDNKVLPILFCVLFLFSGFFVFRYIFRKKTTNS